MENNENEFDRNPSGSTEDGFTKAPEGNNTAEQNTYGQQTQDGFRQAPQNPYSQMGQSVSTQSGQGLAVAGMVLGIISLVCCCMGYIALVLGIVGFVLSLVSLIQKRPGKGMAIAGIICSSISIVILIICIVIGSSVSPTDVQEIMKELENNMQ